MRTPKVVAPPSPKKEKCDCELYYSDPALRERCIAIIAGTDGVKFETDPVIYNAKRLFEYIKTGDVTTRDWCYEAPPQGMKQGSKI